MLLIKDEIELKEILGGVQMQISMSTMQPFLTKSLLEHIEPVLGADFLEEVSSYTETSHAHEKKLLQYLKIALCHYALAHAAPQLTIAIGDVGMALNVQGGMAAVPKWTYAELVRTGLNTGDTFLEKALTYLEKHEDTEVETVKVFKTWLDSEYCTLLKNSFLQNATVMTKHYPALQGSRRMFLKLDGYISEIENDWFPNQLGATVAADLLSNRDSEMEHYKKVVGYVRFVVANKAMSKAIPFLNISKDFRLTHDISTLANEFALERDRRDGLKVASDEAASSNMEKLLGYMDSVASTLIFPDYYNSQLYAERQKRGNVGRFINDPKKTYVVM
jgi:hypothetical protein